MMKFLASIAVALGLATSAMAGDFTTSSTTYTAPDFTLAGGSRAVAGTDSTFTRFPLVAGADYTVSWESADGNTFGIAIYDFVVPDGSAGDPFAYPNAGASGLIASQLCCAANGSVSFTAATDGFGTIELTDFFSDPVSATLTLVTNAAAVPLPAAGLLLVGGLAALGAVRRRKKPAKLA